MNIAIVAFDQFTDIDVFLPWDLLNRVKLRKNDWSVKIVGTEDSHKSVCGIQLPMQGNISECYEADVILFSSGPGTRRVIQDKSFLQKLNLNPGHQLICSMCSGALILGALGLLHGLTATTYPTSATLLSSFGATVVEEPLVIHGNIATAAGCLAAIDLVSWIIERKASAEIKDEVIASVKPVGQGLKAIY